MQFKWCNVIVVFYQKHKKQAMMQLHLKQSQEILKALEIVCYHNEGIAGTLPSSMLSPRTRSPTVCLWSTRQSLLWSNTALPSSWLPSVRSRGKASKEKCVQASEKAVEEILNSSSIGKEIADLITRYRSIEGICNNLDNPHWGAAMNGHHRSFLSIAIVSCKY